MATLRKQAAAKLTPADDVVHFRDEAAWLDWLHQNHAQANGVWMQIAKKGAAIGSVTHRQAVDVALCYGWIDTQKKPSTDGMWLQRFTPRRQTSIWSKANRTRVLELIAEGRVQRAGLEAIEKAKQNGRWESAYDGVSTAVVPDDLAAHLRKRPGAKAFFETLSGQNRYAILFRLQTAKKPETRLKRLAKFVEMLENSETIHPQSAEGKRSWQKPRKREA